MNIKQAKKQIENAVRSYLAKDTYGRYIIPSEKQRPIFLLGAPGIGKTAIMEQLSKEMGIGLISYSMTHHTRQSAIGLPIIVNKNYGGKEYSVSEYTMSEIIASVYDYMELTNIKEGILFLDEINCVSETLAPSMLQFLQYKIFGGHKLPEGWIVVSAGNPAQFNKSVREFDIVTMDRLKLINVEQDYSVWKEYAYKNGIHSSVISYLDIKKGDFFVAETTVDGMNIVTPRAWEDLSKMITISEKLDITVDEDLVCQYLQNRKTAKEFSIYYDLYNKYKNKYKVRDILRGIESDEARTQAVRARFDERLSLIALLLEEVSSDMKAVNQTTDILGEVKQSVKRVRKSIMAGAGVREILETECEVREDKITQDSASKIMSEKQFVIQKEAIKTIGKYMALYKDYEDTDTKALNEAYLADVSALEKQVKTVSGYLHNMFSFVADAFGRDGNEILLVVTELTANENAAEYISRYGCDDYFEYNKELLFYDRHKEIIKQLKEEENQ